MPKYGNQVSEEKTLQLLLKIGAVESPGKNTAEIVEICSLELSSKLVSPL